MSARGREGRKEGSVPRIEDVVVEGRFQERYRKAKPEKGRVQLYTYQREHMNTPFDENKTQAHSVRVTSDESVRKRMFQNITSWDIRSMRALSLESDEEEEEVGIIDMI